MFLNLILTGVIIVLGVLLISKKNCEECEECEDCDECEPKE